MALPATIQIVNSRQFLERRGNDFHAGLKRAFQSADGLASEFENLLERHILLSSIEFTVAFFIWAIVNSHRNPLGILGLLLLSASVFWIMKRNHSVASSWVAALIPCCSGAAGYAIDSGLLGLSVGLVASAVLCWLQAVETNHATDGFPFQLGMAVSLATAVACDHRAAFAVAPFLAAEALRALRRAHLDWKLAGTVLASLLPLPIFWRQPVIHSPGWSSPVEVWSHLLGPVACPLISAVALAFAWRFLTGTKPRLLTITTDDDTLIAAMLCGLPLLAAPANALSMIAIIGAAVLIGSFMESLRRAIPGVAGLALILLAATLAGQLFKH